MSPSVVQLPAGISESTSTRSSHIETTPGSVACDLLVHSNAALSEPKPFGTEWAALSSESQSMSVSLHCGKLPAQSYGIGRTDDRISASEGKSSRPVDTQSQNALALGDPSRSSGEAPSKIQLMFLVAWPEMARRIKKLSRWIKASTIIRIRKSSARSEERPLDPRAPPTSGIPPA